MTSESKIAVDNGNATVSGDTSETADNRHIANGKAKAIADAVMKNETALAVTAKEWGAALFRSSINDGVSLDMLIGESKLAAGFATLGTSEAGRKAKQRLNVYFSNARLVMERFGTLSDEAKAAILSGETSIHYLASQYRDADRKAASEAKKAQAAAEAAADGSVAANGDAPATTTLAQDAEALLERFMGATDEERSDAYDAIGLLVDAMTEAIAASAEAASDEPEAKAA
jgi:hypothetical protein